MSLQRDRFGISRCAKPYAVLSEDPEEKFAFLQVFYTVLICGSIQGDNFRPSGAFSD